MKLYYRVSKANLMSKKISGYYTYLFASWLLESVYDPYFVFVFVFRGSEKPIDAKMNHFRGFSAKIGHLRLIWLLEFSYESFS